MQLQRVIPVALLLAALRASLAFAEPIAIVNGTTITSEEVENAFRRTSVSKKKLTPEQADLYRKHVLNLLIDDFLVNRFLDQEKIEVDPKKVDEHIRELDKKLRAKGETLADFLSKLDIDEARMRQDIASIYRWLALVETHATEATLRKYFEANLAAFDGSEVRASHILVKLAPTATTAEKEAARKKIDLIRSQLVAGTPFAEVAKAHSECPSREVGGDLEFFPRRNVMSEPFAAAAFALPVGQVSEVVETEFGYHLIVVTDKRPGKPVEYEKVAEEVKAQYAADLRASVVARMRAQADVKILK